MTVTQTDEMTGTWSLRVIEGYGDAERIIETRQHTQFDVMEDDFSLYAEIYGHENTVVVMPYPLTGVEIRAHYPSVRHALNSPRTIEPYVGMEATLCHVNDSYAQTVIGVYRDGQEVEVESATLKSLSVAKRFTRRKDGRYREKGSEGKMPYLVLGVAQTYIDRDS